MVSTDMELIMMILMMESSMFVVKIALTITAVAMITITKYAMQLPIILKSDVA
jgi:hypothetical protein